MGNTKSMSSMMSSSSREQMSIPTTTTTKTTTTTATKTIRPTNIYKPGVMMSTINSSRKFYLNLSELKSGLISSSSSSSSSSSNEQCQTTKLVSNRSFEPSPTSSYTDEEYTSLNEIIESIDNFPLHRNETTPIVSRVDDNYANLDLDENNNNNNSSNKQWSDGDKSNHPRIVSPPPRPRPPPLPIELDSQLYSNVRLVSHHDHDQPRKRPKLCCSHQQNSTLAECHKKINMNLTSLHLLTANLLSKLSKNVQKRQQYVQQKSDKKKMPTEYNNKEIIVAIPPQKGFNPFHELDSNTSTTKEKEEEKREKTSCRDNIDEHQSSISASISNSSPSPSELDDVVDDDDDEGFYQTLNNNRNDYDNDLSKPTNNNNNKYSELSDYDYLVSYECPRLPEITTTTTTTTTVPPPLPASSQPNRTQAILKFFEYH